MKELIEFLNNCKVGKGEIYSHTTIQGGKWCIKDIDKFYELMDKYDGYKRYNMIEFPIEECRYVRFDFDFEFDKETYFDLNFLTKLCRTMKRQIKKYTEEDFTIYVFCRKFSVKKNKINWKNGIHIQIPDITTDRDYLSHYIRNDLVKNNTLKKLFDDIGTTNSIENIIDECVYKKNGWVMYGCDKSNYENAYQIIKIMSNNENKLQDYKKDSLFNELKKFSFRNKMYPKQLNSTGEPIIENFKNNMNSKTQKDKKQKKVKLVNEPVEKANDDNNINLDFVKELVECLIDDRSDIYDKWIDVCWTLKSINDNLFDVFDEFSKKSTKYDRCKVIEFWNKSTKSDRTMGTLRMWAKQDNPDMYYFICKKYNQFDLTNTLPLFTDNGFAEDFSKRYCDKFIYQNKVLYYFNGIYWKEDVEYIYINKFISNHYQLLLDKINTKKRDKMIEEAQNRPSVEEDTKLAIELYNSNSNQISRLDGVIYCGVLIKRITGYFHNEDVQFDTKPHLFLFKNKVWDLNQGKFIKPNQFDYMTMTTGYDYEVDKNLDENIEKVDKFVKQILPDDEVRELTLQIVASGMYGEQIDKFTIFNGSGGNGKGVLNKLTLSMLGNYGCKTDNAILTEKKGKSGGTNCAKNKINKRRYVIFTEPSKDENFNCGTIKELTGEKELDGARMIFKGDDAIILLATFIVECNTKPGMKEGDDAMLRRILDILFGAKFTDNTDEVDNVNTFLINKTLNTDKWREDMKIALFHYLQPYFTKLKDNEFVFNIPKSVRERNNKYLLDSNDLYAWLDALKDVELQQHIIEDKDGFLKIDDLYKSFTNSNYFMNLNKKEKRNYNKKTFTTNILNIKIFNKIHKAKHYYKVDNKKTSVNNVLLGYSFGYKDPFCDNEDEL